MNSPLRRRLYTAQQMQRLIRPRSVAPTQVFDVANLALVCLACHLKLTRHEIEFTEQA